MTTSASASTAAVGPRKTLLRRHRRNVPSAVWYAIAAFGGAVFVVLVQLLLYMGRTEPRDARAIVERELTSNTLQPGERVIRSVPVFRRNGVDYFRATRGMLVLTDRRLVYLGAPPRDITGATDAPPTFDQRIFRIDTLVTIEPSFALLGFARALRVNTPTGTMNLGVAAASWPKALQLRQDWAASEKKLRTIGVWGAKVRAARVQLGKELAAYRRQPVYHVVRQGDAISSIASWYETTPDQIRQLNGITGNTIKVGQKLLIRAGAPQGKR